MTENGRKLIELISENEEAREEFLTCKDSDQIIKFAADKGLAVTLDDLDFNIVEEEGVKELDLDEMEAVAGGSKCVCVVGGGGEASREGQSTCACVAAGWGQVEYFCRAPGIKSGCYTGNYTRCYCAVGGGGKDIDTDEATERHFS